MSSLKQFIRNVRAAKTIADERAVVQKESAAIRASFREESHDSNVRYAPRITIVYEVVDTYHTIGGTTWPNFYTFLHSENGHISDR